MFGFHATSRVLQDESPEEQVADNSGLFRFSTLGGLLIVKCPDHLKGHLCPRWRYKVFRSNSPPCSSQALPPRSGRRVRRLGRSCGRDGISEMNRARILPDVAHDAAQTIVEAARLSRTPIVYSHGACRALADNPRCIGDDGILAIADGGGRVGIFMMSFWLTRNPVLKIDHFIAQVRHVVNVGGIGAVAIANDFPMAGQSNLRRLKNANQKGAWGAFTKPLQRRDSNLQISTRLWARTGLASCTASWADLHKGGIEDAK